MVQFLAIFLVAIKYSLKDQASYTIMHMTVL